MQVVMRWLWVVILVLGLTSLVFGVVYINRANSLKTEVLDDYGRYEGVFTAEDIDNKLEMYMVDYRYKFEDGREGYTAANPRPENPRLAGAEYQVKSATVLGLYTDPRLGTTYIASVDGVMGYGMGQLKLDVSQDRMFTGILNIIIGVALVLVAIVIFGIGRGVRQTGGSSRSESG